jgi:L-lysine 2,3-aminomutase
MARYVATANTVQELIDALKELPPEKPVRIRTMSHEFAPDVYEHELCVMLEP